MVVQERRFDRNLFSRVCRVGEEDMMLWVTYTIEETILLLSKRALDKTDRSTCGHGDCRSVTLTVCHGIRRTEFRHTPWLSRKIRYANSHKYNKVQSFPDLINGRYTYHIKNGLRHQGFAALGKVSRSADEWKRRGK